MKYKYAYKTSDGVRHEAAIEAASREEAFAALRAQGIKAIKVVAADGSKANGEVRGVRKRVFVLSALCLVLCAVAASFISFSQGTKHQAQGTKHQAPRHQIYGDPVVVENIDHGKVEQYLPDKQDQMLAWFAQPGKIACPKGVDPRRCAEAFEREVKSKKEKGKSEALALSVRDAREVRELKQMVNGMREELRAYLANGNGTPRSYWRRLIDRTRQENQIYERVQRELAAETDPAVWEQKNQALRNLGLRTIPNPKDGE